MAKIKLSDNLFYCAIFIQQSIFLIEYLFSIKNEFFSLLRYFVYAVSLLILVVGVWRNHRKNLGFVTLLFLCWNIYLIIGSFSNILNPFGNYFNLKYYISGGLYLFFIPFLCCVDFNLCFYIKTFKLIFKFLFIYLLCAILFYATSTPINLELFTRYLVGGGGILLLTLSYYSERRQKIIVFSMLVATIIMMLLARRNIVVFLGSVIVFAYMINYWWKDSFQRKRKVFFRGIMVLIFILGLPILAYSNVFGDFIYKMNGGMSSREDVIECFYIDFNNNPADWIYGRGFWGEFDGGVLNNENSESGLRTRIENGYLQLILKGGLMYLILLVLVSVKAMYKGFFKSRNMLCKGFASLILINFVDMIGFGVPEVTLKYMMVFVAIAACNSEWLLNSTDEYLTNEIGLAK